MINMFQPQVGAEELAAVAEVFENQWLGYGPQTKAFEQEFADHLGVPAETVLFINSATSGLHLAMELLNIGPGDEVVFPSVSFPANGHCVAAAGATPVFCDVRPRTLNPTVDDVRAVLTPRTKAVMLLHYGGQPGDIVEIAELCRERGIPFIEDAACAIGSSIDGRACGTFGDIAIWSFDSRKIITTGDGGMIYVRDPQLARRAHRLAYQGLDDRGAFAAMKNDGTRRWWDQTIHEVGRRLIGNDLTAAIGRVQLGKLAGFVQRRGEIIAQYDRLLEGVPGVRRPPALPEGHVSTNYFYWVQFEDVTLRNTVAEDLLELGIYTTYRYPPLHKVPLFATGVLLPGTDEAEAITLLLPLHQSLTDAEVERVASSLISVLDHRRALRDAG
ncbi:DegT/DnrJ/EryC1/StrS family aminotransferase [Amycolatopsis magusensis]|uniref:Aminotransferase n=1 Tax=Amycolatopsis magusensis TaxID=882444 RepID=A0ABS4PNT7_9PSEU|nr:DegT/DnrJ/EryC1/StrS family aminotransferase [Amycolatopsis magusensis]MBP2181094.1 aminotransferase [Amycolatopsis magusensis]